MITITAKTLSISYDIIEDRMKLTINKDDIDKVEFWITRRFYFSLLFELETLMDRLNISYQKVSNPNITYETKKRKQTSKEDKEKIQNFKKEQNNPPSTKELAYNRVDIDKIYLLENVNIKYVRDKKNFILEFSTSYTNAQSIFTTKTLLDFYTMLKTSFPKIEWGAY
jgi:hypothetical protein